MKISQPRMILIIFGSDLSRWDNLETLIKFDFYLNFKNLVITEFVSKEPRYNDNPKKKIYWLFSFFEVFEVADADF